jgi:hypothetical protein
LTRSGIHASLTARATPSSRFRYLVPRITKAVLCRYTTSAESRLAGHRRRMTRRIHGVNKSSSLSKRRKLKNKSASKTPPKAQDRSTAGDAKLLRWLDQADKQDGPVFNVFSTVIRRGARSSPDVYECTLNLNGKNYLEASYIVEPMKAWLSMTKYRKLCVSDLVNSSGILLTINSTIGNQTHSCGDCIFVKPQDDSYRDWKAQVHEVRAADEHHVFLRCSWLENPEELPEEVISTPSYYGKFELVPSNKMDIIDALAVNGPLKIAYWEEANEDAETPAHGEYYWRQTYNHDTKVLSVSNSFLGL